MQEAQRQAYLEAMGIETYFPRVQLDGAPALVLLEPPVNDASIVDVVDDRETLAPLSPDTDKSNIDNVKPAVVDSPSGRGAPERKAPQINIGGPKAAESLNEIRNLVEDKGSLTEPPPQFAYRLVYGNSLVLLYTGDIHKEADRRFLRNLSVAISSGPRNSIQDEIFEWPDLGLPKGTKKDKQAATDALTHNILGKAARTDAKICVIFGGTEYLSFPELEQDLKIIKVSEPIDRFLNTPSSKRELWLQICAAH